MATPNLFLVTKTLTNLLALNVEALLTRYGYGTAVNVSSMPPEKVGSASDTLNLYLFHAMEATHYRNDPSPGTGPLPISRNPLALSLYYILTAHHEKNNEFDAEIQQLLFGLAMKTFHDYPTIKDDLEISPDGGPKQPVMEADLVGGGNMLNIALRPLTAEEAMGFWEADDSATTRLAAYYEVRPVFLEPEPMTGASGLVFDTGLYLPIGMPPQINGSSALVAFTPPAATGLPPVAKTMSPARATFATGLPVGPVNRINLSGNRLSGGGGGAEARILLRAPHWQAQTPPIRSVRLDSVLNPTWQVSLDVSAASFEMQSILATPSGNLDMVPGFYSVSIEVERFRETPAGTTVSTLSESNQTIVSLGPRITVSDPPDGNGRISVHFAPLFDVTDLGLDVQLAVDGLLYGELTTFAGDATDNGRFVRVAPDEISFQPAFPIVAGELHPIRVVINGAESQPFWAVMP